MSRATDRSAHRAANRSTLESTHRSAHLVAIQSARRAFTLVEAVVFGAIGVVVMGTMITFLWRGSGLLATASRASGVQEELRTFLEHLDADVGEMVSLEKGDPFEPTATGAGGSFRFVVRSARTESDLAAPPGLTWRRVEYQVLARDASGFSQVVRHVAILGPTAAIDSVVGIPSSQSMAVSLARLRIVPLVALSGAAGEPRYKLVAGDDPRATQSGTFAVGLAVELTMGAPSSKKVVEPGAVTRLATTVWCRDRVLEMGWGGAL